MSVRIRCQLLSEEVLSPTLLRSLCVCESVGLVLGEVALPIASDWLPRLQQDWELALFPRLNWSLLKAYALRKLPGHHVFCYCSILPVSTSKNYVALFLQNGWVDVFSDPARHPVSQAAASLLGDRLVHTSTLLQGYFEWHVSSIARGFVVGETTPTVVPGAGFWQIIERTTIWTSNTQPVISKTSFVDLQWNVRWVREDLLARNCSINLRLLLHDLIGRCLPSLGWYRIVRLSFVWNRAYVVRHSSFFSNELSGVCYREDSLPVSHLLKHPQVQLN